MTYFLRTVSSKIMGILPNLAYKLAVSSVNNACFYWSYQPDVPKELERFEK